jgi:hypothetical protein
VQGTQRLTIGKFFSRYRDLYSETQGSLVASRIAVWWIDEDGTVELD